MGKDQIGIDMCQREFLNLNKQDIVKVYQNHRKQKIPTINGLFYRFEFPNIQPWEWTEQDLDTWHHYKSMFIDHVFYIGEGIPIRCGVFGGPKHTVCIVWFSGLTISDYKLRGSHGYYIYPVK